MEITDLKMKNKFSFGYFQKVTPIKNLNDFTKVICDLISITDNQQTKDMIFKLDFEKDLAFILYSDI